MQQLTIIIEDKLGMLATVLDILAQNDVNIIGLSTERGPISEIRMMVDHPYEAQEVLENAGFISHVIDVAVCKLDDVPGELAKITKILSDNDVSIEYIYGFGKNDEKGLIAMSANEDLEKLKELLVEFDVI